MDILKIIIIIVVIKIGLCFALVPSRAKIFEANLNRYGGTRQMTFENLGNLTEIIKIKSEIVVLLCH